jgi:rhodanese-related sulfurtransferase
MRAIPLLLLAVTPVAANEQFPVRELYPNVPTIELEELHGKLEQLVIIDVRSSYEFETLHIKGAQHLSLEDHAFVSTLKNMRNGDDSAFVFYCNGHTCKKSYAAAQKAQKEKIDNVFAFDAGIFDWTKAYPDESVLLGKSPVSAQMLIGKEKFEQHLLPPEKFGAMVGKETIVLDIRDVSQTNAINLFPMFQRSVPMDNSKLERYIDQANSTGKTLLVYDAVGKQVQWLQYFLESKQVKSYYFMKGGALAFLNY